MCKMLRHCCWAFVDRDAVWDRDKFVLLDEKLYFIVEIVLGLRQIILMFALTLPVCLNNWNIFAVAVWIRCLCESEMEKKKRFHCLVCYFWAPHDQHYFGHENSFSPLKLNLPWPPDFEQSTNLTDNFRKCNRNGIHGDRLVFWAFSRSRSINTFNEN